MCSDSYSVYVARWNCEARPCTADSKHVAQQAAQLIRERLFVCVNVGVHEETLNAAWIDYVHADKAQVIAVGPSGRLADIGRVIPQYILGGFVGVDESNAPTISKLRHRPADI